MMSEQEESLRWVFKTAVAEQDKGVALDNEQYDEEQVEEQVDDYPDPIQIHEVVENFAARVRAPLAYNNFLLTNWPCNLVALMAEIAEQHIGTRAFAWRETVKLGNAITENDLAVCTSAERFPDRFDASVFGVLAGREREKAQRAAKGKQVSGHVWLQDVVADLRLDGDSQEDCLRVSDAIVRLIGISLTASSKVGMRGRGRGRQIPKYLWPRNWSTFGILTSYNMPSDGDFHGSPVRIGWDGRSYGAITAVPPCN